MRRCLCLLVCLLLVPLAARADDLMISGHTDAHEAYQRFCEDHPDLTVTADLSRYYTNSDLVGAFLTGEFPYDVFTMDTSTFNLEKLFDKGYCVDLSGSEVIREAVEQMHPAIQRLVTLNGAIYGLPSSARIAYLRYNPEAWEQAGLSEADVPDSFPAYLDFLDAWLERLEDDPNNTFSVHGYFDESLYTEATYTELLTKQLIAEHTQQSSYAGVSLRFNAPDFLSLLRRCEITGRRLYALDPGPYGKALLFETSSFITNLDELVPLRLTPEQPMLLGATLHLALIYAGSQHQENAIEYLEDCLRVMPDNAWATLARDHGPVVNDDYEQTVALWQERVDAARAQLETVSEAGHFEAEDALETLEFILADVAAPENRYTITEEQMALYQAYGDKLYFQPPSVFQADSEQASNLRSLISQFAYGRIPAEMLVKRLNELAIMLENEMQ